MSSKKTSHVFQQKLLAVTLMSERGEKKWKILLAIINAYRLPALNAFVLSVFGRMTQQQFSRLPNHAIKISQAINKGVYLKINLFFSQFK
jgi:hypothetical protein